MKDKVCVVTGANSGFGKALCTGLAMMNARVVLVCRDRFRGEAARSEVLSATGSERVDLIVADLAERSGVRWVAEEFRRRHRRLDVFVHAAGVFVPERRLTGDGVELMMAVNHLAPFLLTNLLIDMLRASQPSRILTVTTPGAGKLELDDLEREEGWTAARAYGASRTCNVLFTLELARRLEGSKVTANAVNPGLASPILASQMPAALRWTSKLFTKSPEKAAEAVLRLLADPELAGAHGQIFSGVKATAPDASLLDPGLQRRLWDWSARRVGLGASGVDTLPMARVLAPAEA